MNKVIAIILAAGNSTRFGTKRNKNLSLINKKPILAYSLHAFDQNKNIDNIIVAIRKEDFNSIKSIIDNEHFNKSIQLVYGGNSRRESVYNCLRLTNADIVIIHDGARPLIKQKYIDECLKNIHDYDGVTMGVKSKDTIKILDDNNLVVNTPIRDVTWNIQTPQCFKKEILLKMHEKYQNEIVTDDCELLEKDHYKIKVIEGDYTNIKITTYDDLFIARYFVKVIEGDKNE